MLPNGKQLEILQSEEPRLGAPGGFGGLIAGHDDNRGSTEESGAVGLDGINRRGTRRVMNVDGTSFVFATGLPIAGH